MDLVESVGLFIRKDIDLKLFYNKQYGRRNNYVVKVPTAR